MLSQPSTTPPHSHSHTMPIAAWSWVSLWGCCCLSRSRWGMSWGRQWVRWWGRHWGRGWECWQPWAGLAVMPNISGHNAIQASHLPSASADVSRGGQQTMSKVQQPGWCRSNSIDVNPANDMKAKNTSTMHSPC